MGKDKEKKERERFSLDKFLAAMKINTESIERGEDPPDFYITISDKQIAIEVTDFHSGETGSSGHPRRAVEQEWFKIQEIFRERRKQYLQLNEVIGILSFKNLEVPQKNRQEQFVDELLKFASANCEELTENNSVYFEFPKKYPLLKDYLKELSLKKTGCNVSLELEWEWDHNAGWVGASEKDLEKIISSKFLKFKPTNALENWLLIISGPNISQGMGRPHVNRLNNMRELNEEIKNGPYEKIYIFEYMFDRVVFWSKSPEWQEKKETNIL